MRSLILCEGATDAVLLSYYLGRTKNWEYVRNLKKNKLIELPKRNQESEEANWYSLDGRFLAIWGVGGKDNFDYAIEWLMDYNQNVEEEHGFSKVVLLMDRDKDETDVEKLRMIQEYFHNTGIEVEPRSQDWVKVAYHAGFSSAETANREAATLDLLSLIIPFERQGALETFLLEAITEVEEDKLVVDACCQFIASVQSAKYLRAERMRVKAELAATFAIMYPDKVFTPIDELLRQIPWERYQTVQKGFHHLETL